MRYLINTLKVIKTINHVLFTSKPKPKADWRHRGNNDDSLSSFFMGNLSSSSFLSILYHHSLPHSSFVHLDHHPVASQSNDVNQTPQNSTSFHNHLLRWVAAFFSSLPVVAYLFFIITRSFRSLHVLFNSPVV